MTCFEVLTLFPEVVSRFVGAGLLGKAIDRELVQVHCTNIRDFAPDKHRMVDDAPFGGGAGMVMTAGPVVAALEAVAQARGAAHRILLTPSAPRFNQAAAQRLARLPRIALVCGRYEGIDERVRENFIDECLSIGDFVLGGGEVAALVVIEAVSRLVDGVLGNPESAVSESFALTDAGTELEYPQYTRPAEFRGLPVPAVLLSGDHAAVARWRQDAARRRTWALRPDLRPNRVLRRDAEIWLGVDASQLEHAAALAEVASRHRVAGIVLIGGSADAALAWASATGGKLPPIAMASVAVLRRRFRRVAGAAPWVVRLAAMPDPTDELPHARTSAELLDALPGVDGHAATARSPALVLCLASAAALSDSEVDAVYAPDPTLPAPVPDSVRGESAHQGLAIPDAIEDGAAPRQPAVLADVALATLRRQHTDRPERVFTERDVP